MLFTKNCNWDLRCVDDINNSKFVLSYAGQILNEKTVNKKGIDEYLSEFNYIEVEVKRSCSTKTIKELSLATYP